MLGKFSIRAMCLSVSNSSVTGGVLYKAKSECTFRSKEAAEEQASPSNLFRQPSSP